jgi:hypothetical protein
MIWSAVLLVWALVGVDVSKAGGNIGEALKMIQAPRAIPWALVALVLYHAVKCSLEWFQSSLTRREMVFAQIDFGLGLVVAVAALVLYFGQVIADIQLANEAIKPGRSQSFLQAFVLSLCIVQITLLIVRRRRPLPKSIQIALVGSLFFLVTFLIGQLRSHKTIKLWFWIGLALGAVAGYLLNIGTTVVAKRLSHNMIQRKSAK